MLGSRACPWMIDGKANKGEWLLSNTVHQAGTLGYNLSNPVSFPANILRPVCFNSHINVSTRVRPFIRTSKLVDNEMSLLPDMHIKNGDHRQKTNKGRQCKGNVLLHGTLEYLILIGQSTSSLVTDFKHCARFMPLISLYALFVLNINISLSVCNVHLLFVKQSYSIAGNYCKNKPLVLLFTINLKITNN